MISGRLKASVTVAFLACAAIVSVGCSQNPTDVETFKAAPASEPGGHRPMPGEKMKAGPGKANPTATPDKK